MNNTNSNFENNNIFQNEFRDILDSDKIIKKKQISDESQINDDINNDKYNIIENSMENNDNDNEKYIIEDLINQNSQVDENKTETVKRRRGRPRKSFNYNIVPKKEKKRNINFFNKENNDIILHLSLKPSDVGLTDSNMLNENNVFDNILRTNEFNERIEEDMSIFKKKTNKHDTTNKNIKNSEYCSENIELSEYEENSSSYENTTSEFITNNNENSFQQCEINNKKNFSYNERIINHDENYFINSNNMKKIESKNDESYDQIEHMKRELKEKNKIIKKLKDELINYKQYVTKNETNIFEINLNLIDMSTGETIIVEKTNIACWWCTYNFETFPFFLPDKYYDDKYYVFGCFCTINCACSYNVNMNDSKIWERFSLLKNMYSDILNNNINISLAAPKEILQKYGGSISIEDYRKSLDTNLKIYRHIIPPLAPIMSYIEEKNKYENLNKINEMKIKRTKPLPNVKNILDNYEK